MAEDQDKDSKTETPSEKKISDALEKGNTPFSREVTNVFSMLAIVLVGYFYIPAFTSDLANLLKSALANIDEWPLDTGGDAGNLGLVFVSKIMISLAPLVLPLLVLGVASALSQNQPRMVLDRIQPKLERISLSKGVKRLLGWHGVREFLKSLFKFSAAGLIATVVCISQIDWVVSHLLIEPMQLPGAVHTLSLQVSLGLVGTITILGAVDLVWTRREWFNNLKMTHQEVKDERKQSEGDPIVRLRSQSQAKDRARKRMISQVDDATLVIANPTHFAVALRYMPEQDPAPVVLAKGQDLIALQIRERAEANEIPVIEDKPLARSLYKVAQIDQEIPVEFYVPIAKIVRILADGEGGTVH